MALKQLKLGTRSKTKYQVRIPVFRVPSDKDFEDFAKDPVGETVHLDAKTRGTRKFYASLKYPDDRVDLEYKLR